VRQWSIGTIGATQPVCTCKHRDPARLRYFGGSACRIQGHCTSTYSKRFVIRPTFQISCLCAGLLLSTALHAAMTTAGVAASRSVAPLETPIRRGNRRDAELSLHRGLCTHVTAPTIVPVLYLCAWVVWGSWFHSSTKVGLNKILQAGSNSVSNGDVINGGARILHGVLLVLLFCAGVKTTNLVRLSGSDAFGAVVDADVRQCSVNSEHTMERNVTIMRQRGTYDMFLVRTWCLVGAYACLQGIKTPPTIFPDISQHHIISAQLVNVSHG
jgi:hypothetical protein